MALAYLLDPNQQFVTRGGVPNVGGLLKVFLNGTDDPATTYNDFEGTENPFPVVLDSNGRGVVIADESKAYRVEVYGADGDLLWTSSPVVPRTYTQNDFTNADKEKLDSIEEGAQVNVQADWAETDTGSDAYIKHKPNLGDYAEKSELAQVAFSGSYDDLVDKPSIPAPQVQSDWAQGSQSAVDYIRNKPTLAAVATSGDYEDLSNKPIIPSPQVNADWASGSGVTEILNKPDIPGMAQTTAAALCELQTNIEDVEAEIPDAQVQADYAQANPNAVDYIKNKPDLSLKEDVANKATDTIDPTSTTQYPSSKAMADFTNSAISTNTGKYISDNGNPFTSASDLPTDSSIVSNNDYAVVLDNGIYYRYKATVVGTTVSWAMEYAINTNAFTPAQQAAIDSTVTAVKVGNYDAHIANTTIHVTQADKNAWNGKQDAIDDLNTIRNGASAGATAVQPALLAEKAEVTAAALCELKENVQGVEEDIPDVTVYAKLSDLAAVAFSGDYDDLTDKPDLSVYATTAAMTSALATKQDTIADLSDIRSGAEAGATAVQPGDLAAVATSGSYDDLVDKPSIPAAQVNSDWNANSGVSQILNKPTIPPALSAGSGIDIANDVISRRVQLVTTSSSYAYVRSIIDSGDLPVLDKANGSMHDLFVCTMYRGSDIQFIGSSYGQTTLYNLASNNTWTSQILEPQIMAGNANRILAVNAAGTDAEWRSFVEVPSYAFADRNKVLKVVYDGTSTTLAWGQPSGYTQWETDWASGYTHIHTVTADEVTAGYFDMYQAFATSADTASAILDPIRVTLMWDTRCLSSGVTSNYVSSVDFAIGVDGGSYRDMFTDSAPAHEVHKDWFLYPNYLLHTRCNRIRIRYHLTSNVTVGTQFQNEVSGLVDQVR